MELCSRCHKNPAVVFVTKVEGDKTSMEGLCLPCARELNIAPVNQMMEQLGIDEEDLDNFSSQMNSLIDEFGDMDEGAETDGGAPAAPLSMLKNLFSGAQNTSGEKDKDKIKEDKKQKESKSPHKQRGKKSLLDTYGTNLTAKAALGKVDRVVNRDSEIERVIQILNRRTKNNPVLLGEPGVGKTAIAEGLACRIFERNVPPKLFDCQLYLLDFTAIVAGTQFRGQFESRLKGILKEAEEMGNVVLMIDEIHNIVAAGDAEGAMSAANILKPALARGEIQVLGATTLSEYRKHIEKDSALERRFQPVIVDEPSIDESIEILRGVKGYYEDYHTVGIPDDVAEEAVRMSERYITDRFLPDKAIDVIDEACSRVNLKNKALCDAVIYEKELENIDNEEKEAENAEDYAKAAELKSRRLQLEAKLTEARAESKKAVITYDDIAAVIEGWTKIPVHRLSESEAHKLMHLEERIHERVIGQSEAVDKVAQAIRRGRADITTRKRPVSFIFAGPTGVGKTELVKTIAEVMFDNEEALIRLDMSEYMEKHSVSKLIGSPPGYVGYDEAGQLTEKVRRRPYSVILLDEIEKAHPEVFNMFLQVLDDGRIADSHGKIINFENTIIIMTTNAGTEFTTGSMGFGSSAEAKLSDNVEKSLKQHFKPEFLNRIDEIVTFKSLTKEELRRIIDLLLKDIREKLLQRGSEFIVTDAAREVILTKGYDVKYGARPLKRAIQTLVEDKLARLSLTGQIPSGSVVTVDADGETDVTVSSVQRLIER